MVLAREYGARRVILFGSTANSPEKARDLDIACDGVAPSRFYELAGRLSRTLRLPVDLVDLSDNTAFTKYISKKRLVLYEFR